VRLERGMLDGHDLFDLGGSEFAGDRRRARARNRNRDWRAADASQLLGSGNGFPRGAVQLAVALFGNDEDHWTTRASSRSLRTSSFAASAGDPGMSCVFFAFSGT